MKEADSFQPGKKKLLFTLVKEKYFPFSLTKKVHRSIRKSSTLVHNVSQLDPDCIHATISLKAV
jgi:hypothetical protein